MRVREHVYEHKLVYQHKYCLNVCVHSDECVCCLWIEICICTTAGVCLCLEALFRVSVIYDLGYGFHWGHIKLQNSPLLLSSLFSPTYHPSLRFSYSLPLFCFIHQSSISMPLHPPSNLLRSMSNTNWY